MRRLVEGGGARTAPRSHLLVLEDDGATSKRRSQAAVGGAVSDRVTVRLHDVQEGQKVRLLGQRSYRAGAMRLGRGSRADFVLTLIDEKRPSGSCILVSGSSFGSNGDFVAGLIERHISFVAEVRPSGLILSGADRGTPVARTQLEELLRKAMWEDFELVAPLAERRIKFCAATLKGVAPAFPHQGLLFAAQTGGIKGLHRGTIFGFGSGPHDLRELLEAVVWARWIRPATRHDARKESAKEVGAKTGLGAQEARIQVRANIALAGRQDERSLQIADSPSLKGTLAPTASAGARGDPRH